ncbi:hypothetical protein K435DRAFT_763253 [Dendrothele bispora CBS 962.96]|uniref:Vacuolar sorting protein Vps3844 C-terminal domain-containing protein n=1 Tax=Dendrothele bispora (strain CBS 962.96) TaxID=1314807 RepID=A0A4S8LD41_DENBC|nr:hypothetical protein K435DRAFT_763253 [Dendrothele bispora CBS 962.96]
MLKFFSLGVLLSTLQLSLAINVYLNPQPENLRRNFGVHEASAVISHHVGLEMFESVPEAMRMTYEQTNFVAQGQKNALVVTLEDFDAKHVLPATWNPSFELSTPSSISVDSLSSVITTFLHRARHVYSSIYESDLSSWHHSEIHSLNSFLKGSEQPVFAAADLSGLTKLRMEYGKDSYEYLQATRALREFFESAVGDAERLQLAVLTYSSPSNVISKRQSNPLESQAPLPSSAPPQQPIGSISTCFTSADVCTNVTSSCSGRGQCVEASKSGRTCFVCACSATQTGEGSQVKTTHWAGESCEKKDVSGPFVLFVGTAVVMILLAVGSVSLLYGVGEQSLPPTLLGTAVTVKKD